MDVEATSMVSSCCTHTMSDLNTSDHLPLTTSLIYDSCTSDSESATQRLPKINWDQAKKTGATEVFKEEVDARMSVFLNNMYDDGDQISDKIEQVAGLLTSATEILLPHVQPRRKTRWRDDTLSCLCAQSSAARRAWKEAGRPTEGPLYEEKGRLRRAVRRRMRFCAAQAERLCIQRREKMFATGSRCRFLTPQRSKSCCSKLMMGGKWLVIRNTCWVHGQGTSLSWVGQEWMLYLVCRHCKMRWRC